MLKKLSYFVVALFSLFVFSSSVAQAKDLAEKDVKKFVEMTKFLNTGDKASFMSEAFDQESIHEIDGAANLTLQELVKKAKPGPKHKEVKAKLKEFGFSGFDDWAWVTDKVSATLTALSITDEQKDQMDQEAESMLKELKEADMPDDQKEQIEANIKQNLEMVKSIDKEVSEKDKAAVKPHFEELQELLTANTEQQQQQQQQQAPQQQAPEQQQQAPQQAPQQ